MLGSIAGVDEVAGLEAVVIVPAVGAGREDEASGFAWPPQAVVSTTAESVMAQRHVVRFPTCPPQDPPTSQAAGPQLGAPTDPSPSMPESTYFASRGSTGPVPVSLVTVVVTARLP